MGYLRRAVRIERVKGSKKDILSACTLTSSRMMAIGVGDKYRNPDAMVPSECGEVTRVTVEAAI